MIDGIDTKLDGTNEQLHHFLISYQLSQQIEIHLWVLIKYTISIEKGSIKTDLHIYNKHQFLSSNSCSSILCSHSIRYSQTLKIKRICSNEHLQNQRLHELKQHHRAIAEKLTLAFKEVKCIPQSPTRMLIQRKKKSTCSYHQVSCSIM